MRERVAITGLAFGGKGVGRIGGKVVFVPFTAPGDSAVVEVTSEKKSFSEGVCVELMKPSELRTEPVCPVFGVCGGCSFQHIRYPEEVSWKQKILEETLRRIGGLHEVAFDAPEASEKEYFYRSRARFHVDGADWGFFEALTNRVVDIEECPLLDPLINDAFRGIKSFFRESGTTKTKTIVSTLELGVGQGDGRTVALFHVSKEGKGFPWKVLLDRIPGLKGIEVRPVGPSRPGGMPLFSAGGTSLDYEAGGFKYRAPIGVFSQVNPSGNETLVKKLIEYAGPKGTEMAVDLFSGVGNLTLPLASLAKETVGVESERRAVKAAGANATSNGVLCVEFHKSDVSKWLELSAKDLETSVPGVVVLDPPREGAKKVSRFLARLKPGKIVYVSCSPPTLARDLSILRDGGYRKFRACLIDLFPRTYHMESIVAMEL